jgi:nucleotide-binding universal stress UspA family protein
MPSPIIVPLDRSGFAEAAVSLAGDVAAKLHRPLQLTLVHTAVPLLPETALGDARDLDAQARVEEQAYLEQMARRICEEAGVSAVPVVLDGPVAPALIAHARSQEAELVVMATHGRGGLSRLFLGSVADRLMRALHCPLLLVHAGSSLSALRPGEQRHVLIPLDGSALAESVIDHVLAVFGPEQLALQLGRVVAPQRDVFAGGDAPLTTPSGMEQSLLAATRYLNTVAVRLRQAGLTVQAEARVDHSVARAILTYAKGHKSDLIAVATRGLGGLARVLLGSVADKLVRGARVPLLVWNPPAEAASEVLPSTVRAFAEPSPATAGAS